MKTLLMILFGGLLAAAALAVGMFFALRAALAPLPGEWSVPLALGPLQIQAGVPSLIRLATSRWGGPLLQGRSLPSRYGWLRFSWDAGDALTLRCAPCTLQPPGLGRESLQLPELQVTVRRVADQLSGEVRAGEVHGRWKGEMARDRLQLRIEVPPTPLAAGYALFAAQVPELQRARIEGTFSLSAQLSLPSGTLTVAPRIDGFAVSGLGTEAWAGARSSCGRRVAKLTADSWITRAVIAAEDQRFHDHPGYDLAELSASLSRNQQAGTLERGASTLSQQLAKLLVTGGERSPARKLRELLYAVEMERTLGKARILRLYLENAPWGESVCGAEAASLHYFGVRAHELWPTQAAWLAAMLHNPPLQARRWAETGRIDVSRAQWVLLGMRGLSRQRKLALAEEMAAMDWRPWWAEPAPGSPPTSGPDSPSAAGQLPPMREGSPPLSARAGG